MSDLFQIKICGVTTIEDAEMVASSGADAIGFNFAEGSSRCVAPDVARRLCESVAGRLLRVGVFVNQPAGEVNRIGSHIGLDVVQLHGDEPVEFLAEVVLPTIKAMSFGPGGVKPLVNYWNEAQKTSEVNRNASAPTSNGRGLRGLLIDASVDGQYGGTGKTIDWERFAEHQGRLGSIPWALAGGLNPINVAEAIRKLSPHGVDVASGVESAAGKKDKKKTTQFVAAAMEAWDR